MSELEQYQRTRTDANGRRSSGHITGSGHITESGHITGSTSREIAASAEAAIREGLLESGDPLPTVRSLASALGASPATVNSAYRVLRERGLVIAEGRRGTRVAPRPPLRTPMRPTAVPAADQAGLRDLGIGLPNPGLLPPLPEALSRVDVEQRMLISGLEGPDPVLLEVARSGFETDGVAAESIAVISGALDAVERLLHEPALLHAIPERLGASEVDADVGDAQAFGHVLAGVPQVVFRLAFGGDVVPHRQKCVSLKTHVLLLIGSLINVRRSRNARVASPHRRPRSTGGRWAYLAHGASTARGSPANIPTPVAKDLYVYSASSMSGGGLVGLTLALDLAQRGVAAVVLDDDDTVSSGSRAICFAKRTLEIFGRLGLGPRLLAKGVTWNVGRVFFGERQLFEFDLLPEDGHEYPAFINLQQYYAEEWLVEACEATGLVDLRWRHKVAAVESLALIHI